VPALCASLSTCFLFVLVAAPRSLMILCSCLLSTNLPCLQVIADLVVYLLQQTAVGTYLQPVTTAERAASAATLPVTMYPGGSRRRCTAGPVLAEQPLQPATVYAHSSGVL
jgi:hypothetical protein